MPSNSKQNHPWPSPLAGRVSDGAHIGEIADGVITVWQEIDQALHPVIGHRGVMALYGRSLNLASSAYPWLAIAPPAIPAALDPSALRAALLQQAADEAMAGGSALFHRFHELLAGLVGETLTERLLRPVWTHPTAAPLAQDIDS